MIKIKSIEFVDDPILGSQILDFTIDGKPASTVVFAGKNGIGKTRLLSFIYNISKKNIMSSNSKYGKLCAIVTIDLREEMIFSALNKIDEAKISCYNDNGNFLYYISYYSIGAEYDIVKKAYDDGVKYYHFKLKTLFSKVDINYTPDKEVSSVSNRSLDVDDTSIPRDLAGEIIQLLVDIKNQDNNDLAEYVENHPDKVVPETKKNIRTKRFNSAFYYIFNKSLRFSGLVNNTIPVFKKGNSIINITDLSSGEKQIVFRGIYLLKNKEALKDVMVLVDEPEISMHPLWNKNIYNYYRRLFKEDNENNTPQLFMATHSEYVIESALADENCVIIKLDKDKNERYGKVIKNSILNTISSAEIKYRIFDIPSIDYHIQLYSYIQNNFVGEKESIKDVDNYLISEGFPEKRYEFLDKSGNVRMYNCLCTYIRNCIDHPDTVHKFTSSEFKKSLNYMIKFIMNSNNDS